MFRKYLFLVGIFLSVNSIAQVDYHAKVMSWNVLNFPSISNYEIDTAQRCPAYRTIINYAQPDVLITCENASPVGIPVFLDQVMNTGPYHYAAGTFINGYDTDNAIYYRDSIFDFVSNVPIHTALRDISHFTLVFKATGDTLHLFCCHLKASNGYEVQRGAEIARLRQVTNSFPPGTNFLIGGDFNIYDAIEPAYTGMLQDNPDDDGNFLDALYMPGLWNDYNYRKYHTQSTHVTSSQTFSGGGLDDRFDMILFSNGIANRGGIYYEPGSYRNIGNDGNHYNKDINYGVNTDVPLDVANALFSASDHLPMMITLSVGPTAGISDVQNKFSDVNIYPDPVNENSRIHFSLKEKCRVQYSLSDLAGRIIFQNESMDLSPGTHDLPLETEKLRNPGFYFTSIRFDNVLISKKIIRIN